MPVVACVSQLAAADTANLLEDVIFCGWVWLRDPLHRSMLKSVAIHWLATFQTFTTKFSRSKIEESAGTSVNLHAGCDTAHRDRIQISLSGHGPRNVVCTPYKGDTRL